MRVPALICVVSVAAAASAQSVGTAVKPANEGLAKEFKALYKKDLADSFGLRKLNGTVTLHLLKEGKDAAAEGAKVAEGKADFSDSNTWEKEVKVSGASILLDETGEAQLLLPKASEITNLPASRYAAVTVDIVNWDKFSVLNKKTQFRPVGEVAAADSNGGGGTGPAGDDGGVTRLDGQVVWSSLMDDKYEFAVSQSDNTKRNAIRQNNGGNSVTPILGFQFVAPKTVSKRLLNPIYKMSGYDENDLRFAFNLGLPMPGSNSPVKYTAGITLLFGKAQDLGLSFGWAFGAVSRVQDGFSLTNLDASVLSVPMKNVNVTRPYIGISYRLPGS